MKKHPLILLLLTVMAVPAARAQVSQVNVKQIDQTEFSSTGTISEEDLMARFSSITPISNLKDRAVDATNVANIRTVGDSNTAILSQSGSELTGAINIVGSNNDAISLSQDGTNLLSLINIKGSSNRLDMTQSGHDLGNLIEVEGSGININLTQNQTGFRYLQQGAVNPVMIKSSSNYVPIIIRNN